jgi:cell division protein FtsB
MLDFSGSLGRYDYRIDAMSLNFRKPGARRALAIVLGAMFAALAAYQVWGANGLLALRRRLHEERRWEAQNEALRQQNAALEKRIHELRTDPKAIEKIAREELMLAGSGEKILVAPQKK